MMVSMESVWHGQVSQKMLQRSLESRGVQDSGFGLASGETPLTDVWFSFSRNDGEQKWKQNWIHVFNTSRLKWPASQPAFPNSVLFLFVRNNVMKQNDGKIMKHEWNRCSKTEGGLQTVDCEFGWYIAKECGDGFFPMVLRPHSSSLRWQI